MMNIFRLRVLISAMMLILFFVLPISAQEKATKEECVEKVNLAIELIKKEGVDASVKKIMDKEGPYIWKDSYVFCFDNDLGKTLAHPIDRLIGFPMKKFKDADGKEPFVEVIAVANKEGKGWIQYNYQGGGEAEARLKTAYFAKVPGENVIVCAGYYE